MVGYEDYGEDCGEDYEEDADEHFMPAEPKYELALTNLEVKIMFRVMIRDWFARSEDAYNDFVKALLIGDLDAMNLYMNKVALSIFSYFDTGKNSQVRLCFPGKGNLDWRRQINAGNKRRNHLPGCPLLDPSVYLGRDPDAGRIGAVFKAPPLPPPVVSGGASYRLGQQKRDFPGDVYFYP